MTSTAARRVAIVTGGTRGIGLEVARQLVAEGFAVMLSHAGNEVAARAAVVEFGDAVIAVAADVADEVAMLKVFERAEREFGGVDVVVNCAGISAQSPLVDLDLAVLDSMVRTNLRGAFVVDQLAARHVRNGGAIINLASSASRYQAAGNIPYLATKAAVEAMTLALARELRGRDITVNAVAPGAIATDMLVGYLERAGEDARAELIARSPLERLGQPDDVATIVVFLATTGRWINGQVIFANGGAA